MHEPAEVGSSTANTSPHPQSGERNSMPSKDFTMDDLQDHLYNIVNGDPLGKKCTRGGIPISTKSASLLTDDLVVEEFDSY